SPIVFNRSLSWTTGRSYGLLGLESLVERPDILHSSETFFSMTFQSLLLKRRLGCKLVVTVNENLPHMGETHPLRRRRKHAVMREADLFIAITSNTRNMLVEEGIEPGRIEIVSSSIDLERFKPAPKDERLLSRLGLRKEDCVVLFVGRFVEEKGIREMLEAHRILRGKNSSLPVRWCFVGAGPLLGLLQKARAAFPSDIVLHPFVPYEQIHSLHQIADIFTLPSKPAYKVAEQFGYVLAESMACQKAVVTTNVGSIPDVIGDVGVLVAPGDAAALAEEIQRFAQSPERRAAYGRKALERAQTLYDARKNAGQLEAIYDRLLKS